MAEGELGQALPPGSAVGARPVAAALTVEARRRGSALVSMLVERARNWNDRLPAELRRVLLAGRLLFQVVGLAGFAGYFASMHLLMRVVSLGLVAGAWYAVYWLTREFGAAGR